MGRESGRRGAWGEEEAVRYLREQGFVILERNFHSRFGEIDIIAQKDGILHFIEVKTSAKYEPIFAITPAKMRKICSTIDYYLLTKQITLPYQIDALLVKSSGIEFVENISI